MLICQKLKLKDVLPKWRLFFLRNHWMKHTLVISHQNHKKYQKRKPKSNLTNKKVAKTKVTMTQMVFLRTKKVTSVRTETKLSSTNKIKIITGVIEREDNLETTLTKLRTMNKWAEQEVSEATVAVVEEENVEAGVLQEWTIQEMYPHINLKVEVVEETQEVVEETQEAEEEEEMREEEEMKEMEEVEETKEMEEKEEKLDNTTTMITILDQEEEEVH